MKYTQGSYRITEKTAIARDTFSFTVLCPEIAEIADPGQFVHILPKGYGLRRPISIAGIDPVGGTLRIVFDVRGKGTEALAGLNVGDDMDMIGPLGHGFTLLEDAQTVALVGGGIGVPPMLPLASYYGEKAVAISGFRSYPQVILQEDLQLLGAQTILVTEDGTAGDCKGFVTGPLEALLSDGVDAVYACGPMPMLRAVKKFAQEQGIPAYISLEERMACGVGACLGCVTKTVKEDGHSRVRNARICTEGPVFDAEEVEI